MPTLSIMTFNVENMLTRFSFREHEKEGLATLLDIDSELDRANLIRTYWNIINDENRVLTALTMNVMEPEVICLQEVDNMRALKAFHDRYLSRVSRYEYHHQVLIEANDPRGIDVAVLSRFKIDSMATHKEMTMQDIGLCGQERVFRRDCLEVNIKKYSKILPIYVCHFKSMSGGRAATRATREAEALAVRTIIEDRFADPAQADWLVVGDLNDYTETDGIPDPDHGLGPLLDDGFSVDLVKNIGNAQKRWTHYYSTDRSYHQLDYMLASPSLASKNQGVEPQIIRNGQPFRAERYHGERWPRIGWHRPKASDHCAVFVELDF